MNYLLSYPRSGNTWMRYCLESLSNERTVGYIGPHCEFESGVLEKNRNESDYFLIKRHRAEEIPNTHENKLVFLVRSFEDVLIRHNEGKKITIIENTNGTSIRYIDLVKFYDNFIGEKILVYYEDFMIDPRKEVERVLDFLNLDVNKDKIDDYFLNIDDHKSKSIGIYGASTTKGNLNIRHSSILSEKERKNGRDFLIRNYSSIYNKYLSRY
jgi:hypothetical protein